MTAISSKNIVWEDLSIPSNEELAAFARESLLERIDGEFISQDHHYPEIIIRDKYILLLIQVPTFDKKLRVTSGVPLYFLISENKLWTLHYKPLASLQHIIDDFKDKPAKQEESFADTSLSLALSIINQLNNGAFQKLEKLHSYIEIVADAVFHGNEKKMVEEIAILNRDVMDFRSIMRSQQSLFSALPTHPFFDPFSNQQWWRINSQMKKMWDFLESITENMHELAKTNTSLLQHKENELLRILSMYSIVAIPVFILMAPFTFAPMEVGSFQFYFFISFVTIFTIALIYIFIKYRGKSVL